MYNEQLEGLISAALADGVLTEKEKQILFKKAQAMGIDLDEFEMVLDARLVELKKAEDAKTQSSAPKSNKLGDVKKCPACGAIVQSYQGVCPECGYAFEGVKANSSVQELLNLLNKKSYSYSEEIIERFPIPMEKAALIAFITWLKPQSLDLKNDLQNAYQKKYEECIHKARIAFPNDKELAPFIEEFEKDLKSIKRSKRISITIKNPWFWIGVVALLILIWIIKPTPTRKSVEKTSVAIETALKKGDNQKAVNLFLDFEGKGKYSGKWQLVEVGSAESIVDRCLAENNLKDAKRIADAAGADYHSWGVGATDKSRAAMARKLYQYCISHGELDMARDIILSGKDYAYKGTYIKDVCTYLCSKGRKAEARQYLNAHKGEIDNRMDILGTGSNRSVTVAKIIQDVIDSY